MNFSDSLTIHVDASRCSQPPRTYSVRVALISEESGYSAIAIDLPGAASQGDDIEGAIRNIRDALGGALATYLEDGGKIPWVQGEWPEGAIRRWVSVSL